MPTDNETGLPLPDTEIEGTLNRPYGASRWRYVERWGGESEGRRVEIRGNLRVGALLGALDALLGLHPPLATYLVRRFRTVQAALPRVPSVALPVVDLSALSNADGGSVGERLLERFAHRPFYVSAGTPALRLLLVRRSPRLHWLGWSVHRFAGGRREVARWLSDWFRLHSLGRHADPEDSPRDLVSSGPELVGQDLDRELEYWRQRLAGRTPAHELPYDRPASGRHRPRSVPWSLPNRLLRELEATAADLDTSPETVLLAAVAGVLARYGADSLLLGVEDRDGGGNILPLTLEPRLQQTPAELVAAVHRVRASALRRHSLPFFALAAHLGLAPAEMGGSLLPVVVSVGRHSPEPPGSARGLELDTRELSSGELASHELVIEVMRGDGELSGRIAYDGRRFEAVTVRRLAGHLTRLLESFSRRRDVRLDRLPMLAPEEQTPAGGARPDPTAGRARPLHQDILDLARRQPDEPAVLCGRQRLDYATLDRRSGRLAGWLRRRGVGPGAVVAVHLSRGVDLPVSLLAILRSGAGYLPLDPAAPKARNRSILQESQPAAVVCDPRHGHVVPRTMNRLVLEEGWEESVAASGCVAPPVPAAPLEGLAYRIYTSGSTGVPNGVSVSHRNLLQAILSHQSYYPEPVDRMLLFPPVAFDSSVVSLFWTLADGGCLVIPDDDEQRDPQALQDLVADHRVTHWLSVPSAYQALLLSADASRLRSLSTVIVAGEECTPSLVTRHLTALPDATLYNEYGPTEGSVWASVHRCGAADSQAPVPIGGPVPGVRLHVLDASLNPLPAGVEGELYLGGAGVVPGYHQRPRLTAARFLPDPFAEAPGQRMYRTGDRVRRRHDGRLDFQGRLDSQVKVRGYRIQIEEVEGWVGSHPAVTGAAVMAWRDERLGNYLAAYFTTDGLEVDDLRAWLKERVPGYMLPSAYVPLERMPRTANGKIDRRALPMPTEEHFTQGRRWVAPRTDTERRLAELWREVLGGGEIGVHDDFFQRGGHSLLATRLATRIHQALGVRLSMVRLFEASRLEDMAQEVDALALRVPEPATVEAAPAEEPGPEAGADVGPKLFYLHREDEAADLPGSVSPWPVRRLSVPDLRFELDVATAAEEAAMDLRREIGRSQAEGPYHLVSTVDAVPVFLDLCQHLGGGDHLGLMLVVAEEGRPEDADLGSRLALTEAAGGRVLRGTGEEICDRLAELLAGRMTEGGARGLETNAAAAGRGEGGVSGGAA